MDLLALSWFGVASHTVGGNLVFSNGGRDVHLLRDASRPSADLRPMLGVFFLDPTTKKLKTPPVSGDDTATLGAELDGGGLQFAPQYPFTTANHSLQIAPGTGIATASANSAANRISNFIIKVTAKPKVAGSGSTQFAHIRIHLHDALKPGGLRLTPDGITAGQLGSLQRFSILGEFTDGVVADLSNHPDLQWQLYQDDGAGNPQPVPLDPISKTYKVGRSRSRGSAPGRLRHLSPRRVRL